MKQTFELPVPPSTNDLWEIRSTVKGGKVRYFQVRTAKYKRWAQEASVMLCIQRVKSVPSPLRVGISIVAGKGMTRKRDADNFLKGVLDLCVSARLIEDDSLMHVVGVEVEFIASGKPGQYVKAGQAYCLVELSEAAKQFPQTRQA